MVAVLALFILGMILVIKGGDWFVDASVSIARISGLPEIFIGATIVSIATTLPEVIVSSTAAIDGHTTMSIGNAVGSMICNIGLILGITTIISPSKTSEKTFKIKSLLLVLYTIILMTIAYNGIISRFEAIFLLGLLVVYMVINSVILKKKKISAQGNEQINIDKREKFKIGLYFVLGIAAILIGSNLLIDNGVILAEYFGVPEAIIALSLIALGTSLPELVTAITALRKGNTGISIGNILGANILNITTVLGISGTIAPLTVLNQNIILDIPVAILLTSVLIVPTLILKKVTRLQGIFFLCIYAGYLTILFTKTV